MPTFRNEFPIFYLEGLFPDVWLFPTFYLNKGCILDITVNLLDGTYEPYHKPENTFTKNPITLQILSNKFQLHSKREFQTTHQTRQFPVMQQNIMRRHSKNQVIMSSYSTNKQIKIQKQQNKSQKKYYLV